MEESTDKPTARKDDPNSPDHLFKGDNSTSGAVKYRRDQTSPGKEMAYVITLYKTKLVLLMAQLLFA